MKKRLHVHHRLNIQKISSKGNNLGPSPRKNISFYEKVSCPPQNEYMKKYLPKKNIYVHHQTKYKYYEKTATTEKNDTSTLKAKIVFVVENFHNV